MSTSRRELITLLGSTAAVSWPGVVRAQQPSMRVIGLMASGRPTGQSLWIDAFVQRLRELGWNQGRNVTIHFRYGEGRSERFAEIAAEFVRLNVDVIVTHNTPPVLAAKQATSVIPIVFATAGDPVGSGVVASLARPGGNVTGLSSQTADTATKRLEILREIVPDLRRLAILADAGNPFAARDATEVEEAGRGIGVEATTFAVRRAEDVDPTLEAIKARADALYVIPVPLLFTQRVRINNFAITARLPTMHSVREYVEAGGLISYGANWPDMWRRAGDIADKVLRGAKPADIPVEQPNKFDLIINLKTASALGLSVPPTLLARADEVIE
jgi:putative ABC transport system substrate-binding protein